MLRGLLGLVCVASIAACVDSATIQCGSNVCPSSYICTADQRCISEEAIAACVGLIDGASCSAVGGAGQCLDGACATVVCGNAQIDSGEVCDDGNILNGDGCNATCRSDERCGNGYIDLDERCDCGDGTPGHENSACTMANSSDAAASCRPDCTPHECGDGVRENSEQCEPGLPVTATCGLFARYQGTVTCTANCLYDASGCSQFCGDGIIQVDNDEACDGTAPTGESCLTYGFDRGVLGCSSNLCRPAFEDCAELGWVPYTADTRTFVAISGTSSSDVWAGGASGAALHWNGTKWLDVSHTVGLQGIWAAGNDTAYATTANAVLFYSNGSWTKVYSSSNLGAIAGNGSTIVAVGEASIAMRQAGTWSTVTIDPQLSLLSVTVLSPTDAYAAGNIRNGDGVLLHYTGGTWSSVAIPRMTRITSVWGRSANDVYVGGSTLLHWDGTTWSSIGMPIDAFVSSISGNSTDVFVGYDRPDGPVAQFDGIAWSMHDTRAIAPQTALWVSSDGSAYSVGSTISHYVGSGWTTSKLGKTITLRAVGGSTTPWAMGDRGVALRFDGQTWRRIPSSFTETAHAIAGDYVVGENGVIGHFTGTRVDMFSTGLSESLLGAWVDGTGVLWAVGTGGALVKYDGTTATTETLPYDSYSIWGSAPNDVWVTSKGGLLHFDGASWTLVDPGNNGVSLLAVWGFAANDVYVAGAEKIIIHYNGTSWTTVYHPFPVVSETITSIAGEVISSVKKVHLLVLPTSSAATGDIFTYLGTSFSPSTGSDGLTTVGLVGSLALAAGTSSQLYARVDSETTSTAGWRSQLAPFTTRNDYPSIYAASEADVYAAGSSHRMIHYDGYLWSFVNHGLPYEPTVVAGAGGDDVWALFGKIGQAAHWDGTTWTPANPGLNVEDIASLPSSHAFVAGSSGVASYAPTVWQTNTSFPNLRAVHATSATSAVAVGQSGSVVGWNGTSWAAINNGPATELHAVWMSSATNLFVAGLNLIAQRNGTTWTTTATPAQSFLTLTGTSAADVFAAGNGGVLMHFDGVTWSPVATGTSGMMTDSTATPDIVLFSVTGEGGDIRGLRRDVMW